MSPQQKEQNEASAGDTPTLSDNCPPKPVSVVDEYEDTDRRNPVETASLWSKFIFQWPYPLLKLGMERPLEASDVPPITPSDKSSYNRDHLLNLWEGEKKKHPKAPSLHRAILKDFLSELWFIQPLMGVSAVAKVAQAVALGLLIESFEDDTDGGYKWCSVLVASSFFTLFEHHHVFLFTWRKGMKLRCGSVAAVYGKSLRLSSTNQDIAASSGKILNLASNDVERFLMASLFANYLLWGPVQLFGFLIAGVFLLGPAFCAGVALLVVVVVPAQFYLSRRFAFFRSKIAAITDRRVTLVSQAISGARVCKMNGWEWQFLERIQAIREKEIGQIEAANRLKAMNESLFFSSNVIVSLFIFLIHVYSGGTLTPRNVFTVMTLVNSIQMEMGKRVSLAVMGVSECYVSISRIQKFLEFPELKLQTTSKLLDRRDPAISMDEVTCYWGDVLKETTPLVSKAGRTDLEKRTHFVEALHNATISFPFEQLTCVLGSVGAGKSALLQTIVGELQIGAGQLSRNYDTLSYAAQDPWIMDGTVRENITMGLEFKQHWYDEVVLACGLNIDFLQFRSGDSTIVGDRGVQCSGGQRARIGLARALYRDTDVLVCDDPLSAVDAKVGRKLFQEAILGLGVDRGKCVILATHQQQYVSDQRCVLMSAGRIACIGSYQACVEASDGKLVAHAPDSKHVDALSPPSRRSASEKVKEGGVQEMNDGSEQKEMNVKGLITTGTFMKYVNAIGGIHIAVFLLILFTATQASVFITIAAMGRWAERPPIDQRSWDIFGLLFGLCGWVVVLGTLRAMISFRLCVQASKRLHDQMTEAVLRAKIEFFDTNPLGRVLNRFSADVGSNDDLLPHTLFDFFAISFVIVGAMVTTITVLPFTLIVLPPMIWYFASLRRTFVTTTRELKRLEGMSRSPIFAMLNEALSGISTIRSNDALAFFSQKFEVVHDAHTRAFFAFIASSRWFGFRLDGLMFLFLAVVCFLSVLIHRSNWFDVDPTIFGLAVSSLLILTGIFQWCFRQSAEVINQFVCVERVLGYGNLPSEAPLENPSDASLGDWPKRGTIDVESLNVRYRESLPLSLEGVSFRIPDGAKLGVCGRTGSGKSTLVQALFRLLESENGCIHLDGIDISTIGLHTLRKRLSVIPQQPTLFSASSVRENLDPFSSHTDDEIRDVLKDVRMYEVVSRLPNGWHSLVAEGGSNFSVGQRQLLCLARAILKKNKVLVLDEPTANVDRRTDQLLQEALSKSFNDATIISVAHRLETIIESDYILVLGHGEVLEFGPPSELLKVENGFFANLVNDTGENMANELKETVRRRASDAAGRKSSDAGRVIAPTDQLVVGPTVEHFNDEET